MLFISSTSENLINAAVHQIGKAQPLHDRKPLQTEKSNETGATMNMKTVIPLGLAVILGLIAAVLVRNAIAHRSSASPNNSNLVSVVVASQDVDPGTALTKEQLVVAKVPAEIAPGHVFSDPNQLVGRVVTSPLAKGQTLMETLLASSGSGAGLQALIPPGMRALTLEVNEFSSVGGFIEPGCRVDLISTLNDPKTHEVCSKTILQNIKVTAIGRSVTAPKPAEGQPAAPPSNSVTLLVTPKQAQTLELACTQGRPWLALRSFRDNTEARLEPTPASMLRDDVQDSGETAITNQTPGSKNWLTPVADPTTIRRTVTFIKNGVESQVTFAVPAPASVNVNTDTTPIPGTGN